MAHAPTHVKWELRFITQTKPYECNQSSFKFSSTNFPLSLQQNIIRELFKVLCVVSHRFEYYFPPPFFFCSLVIAFCINHAIRLLIRRTAKIKYPADVLLLPTPGVLNVLYNEINYSESFCSTTLFRQNRRCIFRSTNHKRFLRQLLRSCNFKRSIGHAIKL